MTSDNRIQKAIVRQPSSKFHESPSQPSQRLVGGLSRKMIVSGKALPPLPDEDQDTGPEADAGTGLSTVDTGYFEGKRSILDHQSFYGIQFMRIF